MKLRKERRLQARLDGVKFVPQYNGASVLSYEDYYGIGNERFNNKFVQFNVKNEEKLASEGVELEVFSKLDEETVENDKKSSGFIDKFKSFMSKNKK